MKINYYIHRKYASEEKAIAQILIQCADIIGTEEETRLTKHGGILMEDAFRTMSSIQTYIWVLRNTPDSISN